MTEPVNTTLAGARAALRRLVVACALVACALGCGAVLAPAPACALEVQKLTAQPNADAGSDVLGGKETRLTWEFQADEDEALTGFTVTLPQGTEFSTEDARVTILSGEDLMDRTFVKPKYSVDGQTVKATFPKATEAGKYFRLELYHVVFPAQGGSEQLSATYELADGTEKDVANIPALTIKGTSALDQFESFLEEQPWVEAWNSNRFLRLFLNPLIIVSSLPVVFSGFLMALAIVLVAFPLAIPFGFILSLMRISNSRILHGISGFYINIIRGTPAFLQIYIAFFGLPLAGVNIGNYPLGVIVMAMNSAAYLCEIFRAGIQSIPPGQNEAARSLGMNRVQTMLYVIIPQTFRNVLPTLTSEFILLYKDTSLLAAVGVMEIVMYAKTIVATTGSITPYVVAALFYLLVTLPLTRVVSGLENRLAGKTPAKKNSPKGARAKANAADATL